MRWLLHRVKDLIGRQRLHFAGRQGVCHRLGDIAVIQAASNAEDDRLPNVRAGRVLQTEPARGLCPLSDYAAALQVA
jgi:hypothetical protein